MIRTRLLNPSVSTQSASLCLTADTSVEGAVRPFTFGATFKAKDFS
jgi:hypothetical protein